MSETATVYATESAEIREEEPLFNDHESSEISINALGEFQNALLFHFDIPHEYLYRTIIGMKLFVFGKSNWGRVTVNVLASRPEMNTVTWATCPARTYARGSGDIIINVNFQSQDSKYVEASPDFSPARMYYLRRAALAGITLEPYNGVCTVFSAKSLHKPYIVLELGTERCLVYPANLSPAAGSSCPRGIQQRFSYSPKANDDNISIAIPTPATSKFRWRAKGSTAYTEIDIGSATEYTMPAGTMPKGAVEYQFNLTDTGGSTSTSAWVEISTEDTIPAAAPVFPNGTLVDSTNTIAFSWTYMNTSGTLQSRADLQISPDGTTWAVLKTVVGSTTETAVSTGAIASGSWYWRVRGYNMDGVAGDWSPPAHFQAVGAPPAPKINIEDASPRPIITWQTTEQEAYELTLDGEKIIGYGTEKRWKSPKYLAPGSYTVTVCTQNSYGFWGEKSSLTFTITNTPGAGIQLAAQGAGAAVRLTWNTGGYDYYLVYRDDIAIARVTETEYLDYLSCGLCTYKVRGCYTESNNYGISAPLIVELYPRCPVIIDVETRAALWLELSEQQHRTYIMTRTRQTASYHIVGQERPSVDLSEFVDETLMVSAAFWADDRAGMRALEALLGRMVCLKTDSGELVVGVLTATAKTVDMFYTSYQLSVTNTEIEEEVLE
nr:MAG TPA: Oligo alginate lyase [Caudoviricetes sp.]